MFFKSHLAVNAKPKQEKMKARMSMTVQKYQESFGHLLAKHRGSGDTGLKPALALSKELGMHTDSSISLSQREQKSHLLDQFAIQEQKSVQFHQITIREYERILGDNPGVSSGPPMSIGWRYDQENELVMELDDYESAREQQGTKKRGRALALNKEERTNLLENVWGVSFTNIVKAEKAAKKIKMQRIESKGTPSHVMRRQESLEGKLRAISNAFNKKRKLEEQRLWRNAYHSMLQNVKRQEEEQKHNAKISAARKNGRSSIVNVDVNADVRTSKMLRRASCASDLVHQLEDHDFAKQSFDISKRISLINNL